MCYSQGVRRFVVSLTASLLVTALACGAGSAGGGGPSSSDDANQAATDLALQSLIIAQLRDVCMNPGTCGAVATPIVLPQSTEPRDVSWALEHLDDRDPEPALAAILRAAAQPGVDAEERRALPAIEKLAAKRGAAQVSALAVLGALHDADAVPILARVLGEGDDLAREVAAWSLGQLGAGAGAATSALHEASLHDAAFPVRCRAADALTLVTGARELPAWLVADDDLRAIGTPLPEGDCAPVAATLCTTIVAPEGDGCLVGLRAAGAVATFPRTALESAPHGTSVDGAPTDPLQLVEVSGEHWLVSGNETGAVHRLVRKPNGRFEAQLVATFSSVPKWYRVDGSTLVVQTADRAVHRVTKRGAR